MSEQLLTFKIKKHKSFVLRQKTVLETLQEFRLRPELYIRALAKIGTLCITTQNLWPKSTD